MFRNPLLSSAVRRVLVSGAALAVIAVPTAHAADDTIQEVVVTGSRIPQPNLTSISPVQSVGADQIKIEGVTRVEDLINNLPQAFADLGGNLSNGSPGTATVSLRNLGNQRTLVLVNGRRLMPGDPTQNGNSAPDLNQIPSALVERVEVLTGGASAVYGADAVAGVVNFIMNDHFEGVRIDANYGFYQHNQHSDTIAGLVRDSGYALPSDNVTDGVSRDITFMLGGNFADGAGNVTVYAGYRKVDALSQAQRDFSACSLGSGDSFGCEGSSTAVPGRFFSNSPTDPNTDGYTIGSNGQLRPYLASDGYNFAPTNFYQRPDERYTAGLFAHLKVSDKSEVYTEFQFMDDRNLAQIAPSGAFLGSGLGVTNGVPNGAWSVNCNNPYLSSSQLAAFCVDPSTGAALAPDAIADVTFGRRNVEGGPRIDDLGHTSYRAVLGSRGDIADGWTYDVYGLYGTTRLTENYQNDVSIRRMGNALLAVTDTNGNVVCAANANGANGAPGCVPYNIWQPGGVTPEALAYIQTPGFSSGFTKEIVTSGAITGDLGRYGLKMPGASDGLGVAFGAEYRDERVDLKTDQEFYSGDLAGQGAPTLPIHGGFNVWELFAEARLPILQGKPFAEALTAEAGYRYSDYNLGFTTDTFKAGLEWAPTTDVRLRGSYQRAVRAPNLQELFLAPKVQLDGSTDPCSGGLDADDPSGNTLASGFTRSQCARTGVSGATFGNVVENSASQYNGLVSGNRDLKPESSDTVSFGVVFTPTFINGLTASVDYFDIKVKDVISSYGADFIVTTCALTGNPLYCGFVHRVPDSGGPADGSLWIGTGGYIEDGTFNLGELRTRGVDVSADYRLDIGNLGRLAFSLSGTYTDSYETTPVKGGGSYDCVGLYGTVCLQPIPEWRHRLRTTWSIKDNLDVTLTWRHIDATKLDHTSSDPDLAGEVPLTDAKLGSREYIDLTGSYTFMENYTLRLGVNNLMDKDPPLLGSSSAISTLTNGNTFPQVYDTLGRFGFVNLTIDF
ncbi:MAG TPA: TonB-dependent receptor [Steroidobacteraceae bacterium]